MKRALRGVLASGFEATGILRRLTGRSSRATIAMYHRILPKADPQFRSSDPGMVVSLEAFRLHVREFASRFDVVLLRDLAARSLEGRTSGKPLLAITFDDGWIDTYDLAAPELKSLGLTATVFTTVRNVLDGDDGGSFANREQVRALASEGFEIGSHTWTHRELIGVEKADLAHEVVDSRAWLEDLLGGPVISFAYPRGKYDAESATAVRRAYRYAVTVDRGFFTARADMALLPRIGIHDDMTNSLPRLRWRLAGLP